MLDDIVDRGRAAVKFTKGGSATGAQSAPKNLWVATPTYSHMNAFIIGVASRYSVQTEYLEAALGLVKRLEISKELIRDCLSVPGCCCCMPLMDSCSYVCQNALLAAKGECKCIPLTRSISNTGWRMGIYSLIWSGPHLSAITSEKI